MKAQASAERRDPKQTDLSGAGGDKHRSEAHVDTESKGDKKKKWIWVPNPRSPREVAFQVLLKRETKGSTAFIEALLEESIGKSSLEPADRGLCKEIVLGCVRWRDMLDELVIRRQKGSRKQQPAVRCLLRMGLYQIVLLDKIPSHAAVSETVGLARRCGQGKEAGFVNAVLRAYADDEEATRQVIADMQAQDPAVAWSHPKWLVKVRLACSRPAGWRGACVRLASGMRAPRDVGAARLPCRPADRLCLQDWVKRYGSAATQRVV